MKKLLAIFCLYTAAGAAALFGQTGTVVRFHTSLGDIDVQLDSTDAPDTVANFLGYVVRGDYANSIIHRSEPGFVIQGGGYYVIDGQVATIPTQAAVPNEYKVSNTRGTIAMAKLGTDPNSATDQWFFNLANNTGLNSEDGGFTVFGHIIDSSGLAVMDAIAALEVVNLGQDPYTELPVIDYTTGNEVELSNLVYVTEITIQPSPEFFVGETQLGSGVYYLSFSNGNYFGYFSYLSDPHYLYHFDLGYEYCFDAGDGKSGVYLYDFKSNTFFYTSPTFSFPYLYDFSLNAVLYYYPDTSSAGHYTTNPRYFYNFATKKIITK